jgi:hypothetical protein
MATIRTCDWTKKRLAKNEQTHTLILGGNEYEICDEALAEMKARLESDEPLWTPTLTRITTPVAAPIIGEATNQEPTASQEAAPVPAPAPIVTPVPIPASIRERLPVPTPAQADAVLTESARFQEGTLNTLTNGKARLEAQKLLRARWEDKFEDNLPERNRQK